MVVGTGGDSSLGVVSNVAGEDMVEEDEENSDDEDDQEEGEISEGSQMNIEIIDFVVYKFC